MAVSKPTKAYNVFVMYSLLKTAMYLLLLAEFTSASTCKNFNSMQNDAGISETPAIRDGGLSTEEYTCPKPFHPKHYTECCSGGTTHGCCPQARYFYEIDNTLATTIAISVTLTCVVCTIIIIVCCFWSRCPLYSACRVQYTHDITTYVSKAENIEMDTMPTELSGDNNFSPTTISTANLPTGVAAIEEV